MSPDAAAQAGQADAQQARLDAALLAALVAVDPAGLGGVCLKGGTAEARRRWLDLLRSMLPKEAPVRTLPRRCDDSRLIGGIDLARALVSRVVEVSPGLLPEADGGLLVVLGAEQLSRGVAARIAAAIDCGSVRLERDGLQRDLAARFAVVAYDDGIDDETPPPDALTDRLAFHMDMEHAQAHFTAEDGADLVKRVGTARGLLREVELPPDALEALCAVALRAGIMSMRAPLLAARAARVVAALDGRIGVCPQDLRHAAALVFAHRARHAPAAAAEAEEPDGATDSRAQGQEDVPPPPSSEASTDSSPPDSAPPDSTPPDSTPPDAKDERKALEDILVAAIATAMPEIEMPQKQEARGAKLAGHQGRMPAGRDGPTGGRPLGSRAGVPRGGARLALVETLRAAAPWQRLRRRGEARRTLRPGGATRHVVEIRSQDLRVERLEQRSETLTIFVADASGSAALARLAEAKGAIQTMLARCYARRDRVALVAFRGTRAEVVLPPTNALARAKRLVAAVAGGGGTPLACALDLTLELTAQARRKGQRVNVVLLTDGRANVCRDGTGNRRRAAQEADAAALALRLASVPTTVVDTSPQPRPEAARIAQQAGARYLPLPHAGAERLAAAFAHG